MRVLTAVFLALTLAPTAASPFEVAGYRSGMTVEQVRAVALGQGLGLYAAGSNNFRIGSPDPRDARYIAFFCRNALTFVSYNIEGGFHAFASKAVEFQGLYGPGVPSVRSEYTPNGHVSQMVLTYYLPLGERQTVGVFVLDTNPIPSVSVTLNALAGPCPS